MVSSPQRAVAAHVPLGATSVAAVPTAPRPSSFSGISAYIWSTHITLVGAALIAPVVAFATGEDLGTAITGIFVAALVSVLGGAAMFIETARDRPVSRLWRRPSVTTAWSIVLIAGSAVLAAITPSVPGAISAAAFPVALAFRAVATGSFWTSSLRIVLGAVACILGALMLAGTVETEVIVLTVAVGALLAFAVIGQDTVYALALEVDDLRTTETERAVTHERQRFAGDLHDIQGQHLQLLAVEAQLVQRLLDTGRHDGAREHAARLGHIAATALDEMRSVVHGYRPVSVETEVANAARVLESAGITVDVRTDAHPTLPDAADRLLGLTIREGITNVLRHTRARRCDLTVQRERREGRDGIAVVLIDSGPTAPQTGPPGNGLAVLERRYAEAGGHLTFTASDGDGGQLDAWLPLEEGIR